ncbi:MAG: kelch repeat-containing protein [Planctomycetota bacterium]
MKSIRSLPIAVLGAAVVSLSSSPSSQCMTEPLELAWSGGIIGDAVTYSLAGDGSVLAALIPSPSQGPTPLAAVFPADPRTLDVGIELLDFMWVGFLDPAGSAEVVYPIPVVPTLSGVALHAQAVTAAADLSQAFDISNPASFRLAFPGESHYTVGDPTFARAMSTATVLADGRVLIAGGEDVVVPDTMLDSWEIFDPVTETFVAEGPMGGSRSRHTATLLDDGRVLIVGGVTDLGVVLTDAIVLDPCTGTFLPVSNPMKKGRVYHTATKLPDGRVAILGGSAAFSSGHEVGWPLSMQGELVESVDVYDPSLNKWTGIAALEEGVTLHGASLLSDGTVLLSGGITVDPGTADRITTGVTWTYDPTVDKFFAAPHMPEARAMHGFSETATGGAMVVGGADVDPMGPTLTPYSNSRSYEDTGTDSFSWGPPNPFQGGPPILRGEVMCLQQPGGGYEYIVYPCPEIFTQPGPPATIDLYGRTPGGSSWSKIGNTLEWRRHTASAILPGEERVLMPGAGAIDATSAEVFAIP